MSNNIIEASMQYAIIDEEAHGQQSVESVLVAANEDVKPSSSSFLGKILVVSVSLMLIVLGLSQHSGVAKFTSSNLRGLLELTNSGEVMPVPFWIIRQDVPDPLKVQDAFYNFYFLRGKSASLKAGDFEYEASFFEGVKRKNSDGTVTSLGYFNPTSPKGLPSTRFLFEYGDKCEATNDYREGQVDLVCGDVLEITEVSEISPCRYDVKVSTPEVCSAKSKYLFLKGTSLSAADGGWWQYKINFFKHEGKESPIYQYHSEGSNSERINLGSIKENGLDSQGRMVFHNGDICESSGNPREGTISVECGCEYEIANFMEQHPCVYDVVVKHPSACASTPSHCGSVSNFKAELLAKKQTSTMFTKSNHPSWNQIYSTRMDETAFPRDLLNVKYTV